MMTLANISIVSAFLQRSGKTKNSTNVGLDLLNK